MVVSSSDFISICYSAFSVVMLLVSYWFVDTIYAFVVHEVTAHKDISLK